MLQEELDALPDKSKGRYRKLFNMVDTSASGSIKASEVPAVMPLLGLTETKELTLQLIAYLDRDNSGVISFPEFAIGLETLKQAEQAGGHLEDIIAAGPPAPPMKTVRQLVSGPDEDAPAPSAGDEAKRSATATQVQAQV